MLGILAAVTDAVTDDVARKRFFDRLQVFLTYLVLLVICTVTVVPLYVMFLIAFSDPAAVFEGGTLHLFPRELTVENFVVLFTQYQTATYLFNSIVVTIGVVVGATTISVIGGYILTRFRFLGKQAFSRSILLSYMFSGIVTAVPLYIIFARLNLLNSRLALIVGLVALLSPFNIWIMWQYFKTIPISLEERAWLEGASRPRAIVDVVVPVARPGIITAGIFAFTAGWNNFLLGKIILSEKDVYTLPVAAPLYLGRDTGWEMTMAMAMVICVPPFLLALFFQRYLLLGINLES